MKTMQLIPPIALAMLAAAAVKALVPEPPFESMMIGAALIFPLLLWLHTWALVKLVHRLMYADSSEVTQSEPARLSGREKAAVTAPSLRFFDTTTDMPAEVIAHRKQLLKRAKGYLLRRWRANMFAAAGYLILPVLGAQLGGKNLGETASMAVIAVVVYVGVLGLSYAANRAEYRPDSRPQIYRWHPIALYYVLLKAFLRSPYDAFILLMFGALVIMVGTSLEPALFSNPVYLGLLAAIVLHGWLLGRAVLTHDEGPGIKLLVLRVFGRSDKAILTFDHLLTSWPFFGLHFTVDDPDLARHRYRFFQNRTMLLYFGSIMMTLFYWAQGYAWLWLWVAVFAWDWLSLARRWPVASGEAARERIEQAIARPRNPDGSFRDVRMPCHMNTWKLVVDQFIRTADLVLFDLREFSVVNDGSRFEVNFLFDTFPVSSIVLLTDTESDYDTICAMLEEEWREQKTDSPNVDNVNPEIRIFVSDEAATKSAQALMDLLLATATSEQSALQGAGIELEPDENAGKETSL